ncbi:hypothetical protein [Streptomyces sp. NPDC055400]
MDAGVQHERDPANACRPAASFGPGIEFERVRTALAEAEEVLNHRVIGLEQYLEALDEQDACVDMESDGALQRSDGPSGTGSPAGISLLRRPRLGLERSRLDAGMML